MICAHQRTNVPGICCCKELKHIFGWVFSGMQEGMRGVEPGIRRERRAQRSEQRALCTRPRQTHSDSFTGLRTREKRTICRFRNARAGSYPLWFFLQLVRTRGGTVLRLSGGLSRLAQSFGLRQPPRQPPPALQLFLLICRIFVKFQNLRNYEDCTMHTFSVEFW